MYFEIYKGDLFIVVLLSFLYNHRLGLVLLILYAMLFLLAVYNNKGHTAEYAKKQCRPNSLDNPYGNYLLNSDPKLSSCDDEKKATAYNTFNLYGVGR